MFFNLIKKPPIYILAILLTLGVVFSQINHFSTFKGICDAEYSIAIAEGHLESVPLPFARRVFHPWIISALRPLLGTDLSFFIIGTFSLFIFLLIILGFIHYRAKLPFVVSAALIFIPYLFMLYRRLYLAELFFAALSSIYWILLIQKRYIASLLILLPLLLTRQEAMIIPLSLALSILIIGPALLNKKRTYLFYTLSAAIVGVIGLSIVIYVTRNNSNIHHLQGLLYLLFKIPANAVRNFTGFHIWLDTYQALPSYIHGPLIAFDSPGWVSKISIIKRIGIYNWNIKNVLWTLFSVLSVLGTGPTILFYFIKKGNFRKLIVNSPLSFNAILLYGVSVFILAPLMSFDLPRLYFNAWPACFLIIPFY